MIGELHDLATILLQALTREMSPIKCADNAFIDPREISVRT